MSICINEMNDPTKQKNIFPEFTINDKYTQNKSVYIF